MTEMAHAGFVERLTEIIRRLRELSDSDLEIVLHAFERVLDCIPTAGEHVGCLSDDGGEHG